MPRRLINPGPFELAQLDLPHATEPDLETARQVKEKFFRGVELTFALFAVPTLELIESSFVDAIARKAVSDEGYVGWRGRGAPERELRKLYAEHDAAQRRNPAFAGQLARIETLEGLFAEGAPIDPLIARSLEVPLSTGEDALFVIDGRHRLLAAAASGVDELEVYIGKPTSG